MMHCAINSTHRVCWQDGEVITDPTTGAVSQYPGFAPTFSADWDGASPYLLNVVGIIPFAMPFAGWPNIDHATWQAQQVTPAI